MAACFRTASRPAAAAAWSSAARRGYRGGGGGGGGPIYDLDAAAWFDAAGWGNDELTKKQAVSDAYLMLKDAGLYAKMDRLWLPSSYNPASGIKCLKSLTDLTPVGDPTWTQWQGFTLNGSTQYLDTGFAPDDGVQYQQNSGSFGADLTTASTGTNCLMGNCGSGGASPVSNLMFLNANIVGTANYSGFGGETTIAHGGRSAWWAVSRVAFTGEGAESTFKDGVLLKADNTQAMAPGTNTWFIGARNQGATANLYTPGMVHHAFVGAGLNGLELSTVASIYLTLKANLL